MSIGTGLLDAFEIIHSAGLTHNDLKPENIMLGSYRQKHGANKSYNVFRETKMHLIDYGFARPFMVDGQHISEGDLDNFKGNIAFASLNLLNFKKTSRKDDLEALLYLLVFLLRGKSFMGFNMFDNFSTRTFFALARKAKKKETLQEMCRDKAEGLKSFASEIEKLGFSDTPDYDNLRDLIIEGLDMDDLLTEE